MRPRRARTPSPKEISLHVEVAKLLKDHSREDWIWTHIPTGEERPAEFVERRGKIVRFSRQGAKLKAMGTRPNWPDFIFVSPYGSVRFLELKRLSGKLSDGQEDFRLWCIQHGVPYVVAWTMDQVLAALDSWGCLRIRSNATRFLEAPLVDGDME